MIMLVMIVLFAYAWIKKIKREEIFVLAFLSFGTLVLLIFLSHLNIKLYVSRYFMPAAILIYSLLAILVVEIFSQRMAWLAAVLAYALMLAMLSPIKYNNGWYQLYTLKEEEIMKNRIVITSNPFDYTTAKFYFGEEKVRFFNQGNPREDFSGWVVVGNKNKIESLEELKEKRNAFLFQEDVVIGAVFPWKKWEGLINWLFV